MHFPLKKLNNNRGAALIMAYFVMSILVILAVGIAMTAIGELNDARRYQNFTQAFWLAESALSRYKHDPSLLDDNPELTIKFGDNKAELKREDTGAERIITATGFVSGSKRSIEIKYPAVALEVFNHTVSVTGNIQIQGQTDRLSFFGKTQLSGKVLNSSKFGSLIFDDLKQGLDPKKLSLHFPDVNQNGSADEFDDFVLFQQNLLKRYSPGEVLYIQGNGTYTITPASRLKGKKIIYVEGGEGNGDVQIQWGQPVEPGQNLTVISTGTVHLNLLGDSTTETQLNIIAWGGYMESAPLGGTHKGMIFTHGIAHIDDVYDDSATYGGLVANGGLKLGEIWSNQSFHYFDTRKKGVVPPGFEGLIGGGGGGYFSAPNFWREI